MLHRLLMPPKAAKGPASGPPCCDRGVPVVSRVGCSVSSRNTTDQDTERVAGAERKTWWIWGDSECSSNKVLQYGLVFLHQNMPVAVQHHRDGLDPTQNLL
jgi:hypothetical protein